LHASKPSNKTSPARHKSMRGNIATAFHHVSTPLPTTQNLKGENLRRGKVLTGEYQMWRGPPSSIDGKAANNNFYVWVCRYPIHTCCSPHGVDCTCTCTGNLPHQVRVLLDVHGYYPQSPTSFIRNNGCRTYTKYPDSQASTLSL
jgi:hypothetical protein